MGGLLCDPPRPVDRFTAAPRSVFSRDIAARLACEGALSSGREYPHSADPTYLSSSSLGLPNLCWASVSKRSMPSQSMSMSGHYYERY